MIEVFHIVPSRSTRVVWLLNELNVPHKIHPLQYPVRQLHPEYVAMNPTGLFPYMIDGDVHLFESMAICDYIARHYGGAQLLIGDAETDYAEYQQWLLFGEATLAAPLANIMRYGKFMPEPMQQPAVVADASEAFAQRLTALEKHLRDHGFAIGNRFTLADISLTYPLYMANFLGIQELFGPAVQRYWQALSARPAFKVATAQ